MYICNFCNLQLKTKYTYQRHLKNVHLNNYEDEDKRQEIFAKLNALSSERNARSVCKFCEKTFANEYVLKRHQDDTCKKKPIDEDKAYKSVINLLETELPKISDKDKLDKLQELLDKYKSSNTTTTRIGDNNTINSNINNGQIYNNNNNNININLRLVNFGEEETKMLSENEFANEIFELLESNLVPSDGYFQGWKLSGNVIDDVMLRIHKRLHCNKDYPQNHNMYVTNQRFYVPFKVYKDNNWVLSDETTLETCVEKNSNHLLNLLDELIECNPDAQDTLINIKDAFSKSCDSQDRRLQKKIFQQTYDHRDVIKDTYKVGTVDDLKELLLTKD